MCPSSAGNSARGTSCDASLDQTNCIASSTPRANESFLLRCCAAALLRCGPVDLVFSAWSHQEPPQPFIFNGEACLALRPSVPHRPGRYVEDFGA